MKRIFTLLFFCFIAWSTYAQWTPAEGVFGIERRNFFINKDKKNFWVSTNNGIYYSNDDAASWMKHPDLPHPPGILPTNIVRKDNDLYIVYTSKFDTLSYYNPIVYKSTNNGQSWKEVIPDSIFRGHDFFRYLSVIQGKLVVFIGNGFHGRFIVSEDDGRTWNAMAMPLQSLRSQWDSITIAGGSYVQGIFVTRDVGASWSLLPGTVGLGSVSLMKDSIIIASRGPVNGKITYEVSKDLGQHWELIVIDGQSTHYERLFHIDADGIIYTHESFEPQQVYYSTDKGSIWLLKGSYDAFVKPGLETSDGSGLRRDWNRLEKLNTTDSLWENSVNGIRNGVVSNIFSNEQYVFTIQNNEELWRKPVWSNTWELIRRLTFFNNGILYKGVIWEDKVYIASESALLRVSNNGAGTLDTVLTYPFTDFFSFTQTPTEFLILSNNQNTLWKISKADFTLTAIPKPYGYSILADENYYYLLSDSSQVWRSAKDNINWTLLFKDPDLPVNNWPYRLYAHKDQLWLLGPQTISVFSKQSGDINYIPSNNLKASAGPYPYISDFITDSDTVYISTWSSGVLKTSDGGVSWSTFNDGYDGFWVNDLELTAAGQLLAGTATDGLWELPGIVSTSNDVVSKQPLSISPNPTKGLFFLKRDKDSTAQLRVYNAIGHCLLTHTVSGYSPQIDLSGLPAGAYYLVLQESESTGVGLLLIGQ